MTALAEARPASEVTELEVLVAARDQIKKGYTNQGYVEFRSAKGNWDDGVSTKTEYEKALEKHPNDKVFVCAIGGVEQALFRLCKENFQADKARSELGHVGTTDTSYQFNGDNSEAKLKRTRSEIKRLYGNVMWKLNLEAISVGADLGFNWTHIEDPNTTMGPDESKPHVLKIYNNVIRKLRAEARKKEVAA